MIKNALLGLVCAMLVIAASATPCRNENEEREKNHIWLVAEYNREYGLVLLSLDCREFAACGLLLEIRYDTEHLEFTSASRKGAKPSLDFSSSLEDDGRVILLFDGEDNDSSSGRLVTLCFRLKKRTPLSFRLACADRDSCFEITDTGFLPIETDGAEYAFDPVRYSIKEKISDLAEKIERIFKRNEKEAF